MQMNEKILTALEVLRDAAENDFERHRIDVLEQDLTAPPKVEVIDETHQKFNGEIYYRNKGGYFTKNFCLHSVVWFYCYGEIPAGYDVHHKDLNPANNDISNLHMLTKAEHHSLHNKLRSEKSFLENRICLVCGKIIKVTTSNMYQKFCSLKCAGLYVRKTPLEKKCSVCGKLFQVSSKNSDKKFCSVSCANIAHRNRGIEARTKKCEFCGKEFIASRLHIRFCSSACANKFNGSKRKACSTKT